MRDSVYFAFVTLMSIERVWETFFCWSKKPGVIYEGWTLIALSILHIVIVLSSIFEHMLNNDRWYGYSMLFFGLTLYLLGVIGRVISSLQLKEFHSAQIELREGQPIISNGLYAFTKHPYYFSVILELIGFPLFVQTPLTLVPVFSCYLPMLLYRAKKEEKFMRMHFGENYLEYQSQLKGIWKYWLR